MKTDWSPNSSRRPVLAGVPVAIPNAETVSRVTTLYYLMIGSLAEITQTAIKDLHDVLAERKDLFKQNLKYRIKEAYSRSDILMGVFRSYTTPTQYQLWLDVTDAIEEDLKEDVIKLYYTTDNILLKHNAKEHQIQSLTVVAYNLTVMLHDMSERYDKVIESLGIGVSHIKPSQAFLRPMYGMYASMREVADMLIEDKDAEYFKEGGMIFKALEILALKVCNIDRINNMADVGLKVNGVNFDGYTNQENSFTEWNCVQTSVLEQGYNKGASDEELAKILGRSVGSIKTKAKQLKLKRNR